MNDQETVRMGGEVHAELLRLSARNAALLEALVSLYDITKTIEANEGQVSKSLLLEMRHRNLRAGAAIKAAKE